MILEPLAAPEILIHRGRGGRRLRGDENRPLPLSSPSCPAPMTPARLLSSLSSKATAIARHGPAYAASAAACAGNSRHITTPSGNLWWAAGGWIFFVAENALLSENREAIIAYLDDEDGSNGDNRGQPQGDGSRGERSARARGASSVGDDRYHLLYGIASTAATASIGYSYYRLTRAPGSAAVAQATTRAAAATMAAAWACLSGGWALALQAAPKMQVPVSTSTWQVRCPFDFTDSRREAESQGEIDVVVRGLERITRHPVRRRFCGLKRRGGSPT
jgi:hypothetical protein